MKYTNPFALPKATRENPIVFFERLPERGNFDRFVARYKSRILDKIVEAGQFTYVGVEFDPADYVWKLTFTHNEDKGGVTAKQIEFRLEDEIARELDTQVKWAQESMQKALKGLDKSEVTLNELELPVKGGEYALKLITALNSIYSSEEHAQFVELFHNAYCRTLEFVVDNYEHYLSPYSKTISSVFLGRDLSEPIASNREISSKICDAIVDFEIENGESLFEIGMSEENSVATRWKYFFYKEFEKFDGKDPIAINQNVETAYLIISALAKARGMKITDIERRKVFLVKGKPFRAQSFYKAICKNKVSNDRILKIKKMFEQNSVDPNS